MTSPTPRVLVAYATKHGSTAEIAEEIATTLRAMGLDPDVRDAAEVEAIVQYDAVILGSALYMGRWRRSARSFARRYGRALRTLPVWLFSSGPLDDTAATSELEPPSQVAALTDALEARGHVTFGGVLDPEARGPVARAMVRNGLAGDFRDHEQIAAWAREVAAQLRSGIAVPAGDVQT